MPLKARPLCTSLVAYKKEKVYITVAQVKERWFVTNGWGVDALTPM